MLSFAKFSSLMVIGPIFNKIQLFKNLLENLLRSVWIGGLTARMSRNFSVNFEVFERQYLLQYTVGQITPNLRILQILVSSF